MGIEGYESLVMIAVIVLSGVCNAGMVWGVMTHKMNTLTRDLLKIEQNLKDITDRFNNHIDGHN